MVENHYSNLKDAKKMDFTASDDERDLLIDETFYQYVGGRLCGPYNKTAMGVALNEQEKSTFQEIIEKAEKAKENFLAKKEELGDLVVPTGASITAKVGIISTVS